MNEIFAPPPQRPTTQAAEGLPRWRWTVAEIEKLAAAGHFHEYERIELLGGEIVPISPKGRRHEIIRGKLALHLSRSTLEDIFVASEAQLNLAEDTYVMPDILVHSAALETPDVRGGDVLLLIEVADASLRFDLTTKEPLYAAHGVREYWVINALTLTTKVHREPSDGACGSVDEVTPEMKLVPLLVPNFAVSLGALRL